MTATAEKTEAPAKAKGAAPVIKGITMTAEGWKDTVALWLTSEDATAKLKGFIMDGDTKVNVLGFINDNTEKGTKFISLSKPTEGGLVRVGTGNAINTHKDGSPVYFDTIAFNIGDKSVFGRLTASATAALQQELGFTSLRQPRPPREAEAAIDAESSAPRPRG